MTETERLAKELFREEYPSYGCSPFGHRPQLEDLWPCDQEKYKRRAEQELRCRFWEHWKAEE